MVRMYWEVAGVGEDPVGRIETWLQASQGLMKYSVVMQNARKC
jgi:hypothetical protein